MMIERMKYLEFVIRILLSSTAYSNQFNHTSSPIQKLE
jgi:hypothetical protein